MINLSKRLISAIRKVAGKKKVLFLHEPSLGIEEAKNLPMPFDGLGRIGELSGQISSEQWNDILGSTDELKKKNPELAKSASEAMILIK